MSILKDRQRISKHHPMMSGAISRIVAVMLNGHTTINARKGNLEVAHQAAHVPTIVKGRNVLKLVHAGTLP